MSQRLPGRVPACLVASRTCISDDDNQNQSVDCRRQHDELTPATADDDELTIIDTWSRHRQTDRQTDTTLCIGL